MASEPGVQTAHRTERGLASENSKNEDVLPDLLSVQSWIFCLRLLLLSLLNSSEYSCIIITILNMTTINHCELFIGMTS